MANMLAPFSLWYPEVNDTDYPDVFYDQISQLSKVLQHAVERNYVINEPSSGTISTAEVRVLDSTTISFQAPDWLVAPTQISLDVEAIGASVETTVTSFAGYLRAEIWVGGSLFSSAGPFWFGVSQQGHIAANFSLGIELGSVNEIRLYSAARSATNRFKLFEARFPSNAIVPTKLKYKYIFTNWT